MTAGMPMDEVIAREIREMIEHAAGAEIVSAIREADRRTHEIIERMSNEEFANWIMGVEP